MDGACAVLLSICNYEACVGDIVVAILAIHTSKVSRGL